MSSPYGPPPGGQQGPGQNPGGYGAPGSPSWAPAPQYGAPQNAGYGAPGSGAGSPAPVGPPPGYGQPFGAPGQGTPPGHAGQGTPSGQWSGSAAKTKAPTDLGKILPLVLLVLGVIGFIAGFLPAASYDQGSTSLSISVFGGGPSYLPVLLLLVGLLACAPLLPGGRKLGVPTLLLAVAGLLGAIAAVATSTVFSKLAESGGNGSASKGFGIWLLLIVAVLEVAAAGYAWFTESGSGATARPSGERGSGHAARSFGPGQATASSPAPVPSASAGYAPQGYGQGESPSYGGYMPSNYPAPGAPTGNAPGSEGFGQYVQQPSDSAPHTGSNQAVGGHSPYAPYGQGQAAPASSEGQGLSGPSAGQHGRDDGPSPDVTQQVRF